jgi:nucleoside-diphosphate-sugar epimerase
MILITCGAGVVGSRLVKKLVNRGRKVRVLTLPGDQKIESLKNIDCEICFGDISVSETLNGVFDGIDTVYHLAAVIISNDKELLWKINLEGTKNVIKAAMNAGIKHFIYISSISAEWPEGSDYAMTKIAAEQLVKSNKKIEYTIIRPTLIYGCNEGQEFNMFVDSLKKYPVVFFVGRGRAKKNPIFVDDIVKGLSAVAYNKKTYGKIYNFSGGQEISIRDMSKLILKHQNIKKMFIPVPVFLCKVLAYIMEKTMKEPFLTGYAISRIMQEASADNSEAKRDLGYNPIGIIDGLGICYPLKK